MTYQLISLGRRKVWMACLVAGTGLFAGASWAQELGAEADAPPPPKASANRIVEEIVVTAQKREENLMEVPISIAAFSGDALEARGAVTAEDLKFVTPGLVYDNLVGYSLIYMRGVGTEVFVPHGEPSVATYIDGIYFPFAHGLAQDFTKLERIEVLKGPQGTLFGRNATGGAINIVGKKPGPDLELNVDLGMRNYDGRMGKVYANIPMAEGLAFSVSGLVDRDDTYYEYLPTSPQQTFAPNVSKGFNPRISWQIADNLALGLSGYHAQFNGTGTVVNTNTDPKPLGVALGVVDAGDRKASVNEPEWINTSNKVVYGNLVWNTALADVKLLASDAHAKTDTRWDYDGGPGNYVFFWPINQFMESTTGELQIVSNADTPFSDVLEWTAGLYYFESKAGFDPMYVGVFRFESPGPLGDVLGPLLDGIDSLGLPIPLPQGAATVVLHGILETKALAEYVQATWSPTDWVSLTMGGRYQQEKREVLRSEMGVGLDGLDDEASINLLTFGTLQDFKVDKSDFSPRVALDFHVFDDELLYASWSQAFKSGTYNIVSVYTPPTYVKPEKTTAYELGIKGTVLDGNLRYTGAVFHNNIDDLQTQVVSVLAGGLLALANAAEATIYGAEFDATWIALPDLLPGLAVTLSGAYLHGEYDSFPGGTGFDEVTGLYFGPNTIQPARDQSGNRTVRTPKFTGSFGLNYAFDAPGGTVEIGGDVYYNDGYFFDTQNVVTQPSYYTLNARASYLYQPWDLRVSFVGKNLTDEFYYYNQFATDFGVSATGGPPPSYAVTLSWSFY